jgi:NDP-sugar pyrophosphorylase family protein
MDKRAVILAGGRGTRLRPFTIAIPKPLVPVGDEPVLAIILRQLRAAGFSRVTMAVNHQADLIRAYFGDGSNWGLRVDYSLETMALGTMAPLRLIRDLPENFIVMNGDVLANLDLGAFFDAHCRSGSLFTISACRREQHIDYGVLEVDPDQGLKRIIEKPTIPYLVSMGIYAVNRRTLELIPENTPFGFDQHVQSILEQHHRVDVIEHKGYWLDIGRPDDYERATEDVARNGIAFFTHGIQKRE